MAALNYATRYQRISIHAPLAGCDTAAETAEDTVTVVGFQSTHPLRGATVALVAKAAEVAISIHAPLAGCDLRLRDEVFQVVDFNPRTPCGVRPCNRM